MQIPAWPHARLRCEQLSGAAPAGDPLVPANRGALPRRRDCVLLPFAAWKNRPSAARLTMPTSVGVCRSPVSRLFSGGVGRCADSVLIAAADRDTCEAVLGLSRVTRLKGRGDATPPARRRRPQGEWVRRPARCGACRRKAKLESARASTSMRRVKR